jgi:hypothetical protein
MTCVRNTLAYRHICRELSIRLVVRMDCRTTGESSLTRSVELPKRIVEDTSSEHSRITSFNFGLRRAPCLIDSILQPSEETRYGRKKRP